MGSISYKSTIAPGIAPFYDKFYFAAKGNSTELYTYITQNFSDFTKVDLHEQSNEQPAITVYNGKIVVAFRAASSDKILYLDSSDGDNWTKHELIGELGNSSPALAVFEGKLYLAYAGTNQGDLYVMTTDDLETWERVQIAHSGEKQQTEKSPALAVYEGSLYLAYTSRSKHDLLYVSSTNGTVWSGSANIESSNSDYWPALTTFDGQLYIAYKSESSNEIYYRGFTKSEGWGTKHHVTSDVRTGISACVYNQKLYFGYLGKSKHIGITSPLTNTFSENKNLPKFNSDNVDLLDVWGEGRIVAGDIVTGFTSAYNFNNVFQAVSNGPNEGAPIPNLLPVNSYYEGFIPLDGGSVATLTLMGAPIYDWIANEMIRVLKLNSGKVYLYDPSDSDRTNFEKAKPDNLIGVKYDSPADLPSPFNEITLDGAVYVYSWS
ncbi:MAG: hypothetical protein SCALA702_35670 [Melioribacteraceae bacterium]|nr:MAG: hypothetical protein SCALA702_35670 [Melioribacteraceae bacterium]